MVGKLSPSRNLNDETNDNDNPGVLPWVSSIYRPLLPTRNSNNVYCCWWDSQDQEKVHSPEPWNKPCPTRYARTTHSIQYAKNNGLSSMIILSLTGSLTNCFCNSSVPVCPYQSGWIENTKAMWGQGQRRFVQWKMRNHWSMQLWSQATSNLVRYGQQNESTRGLRSIASPSRRMHSTMWVSPQSWNNTPGRGTKNCPNRAESVGASSTQRDVVSIVTDHSRRGRL
jgi:hypothetical protein